MTQTPLQEAIQRIEAGDPKYCTPAEVVSILESLLPKEKQFIRDIWEAALDEGDSNNPTCTEIINQLYPEK